MLATTCRVLNSVLSGASSLSLPQHSVAIVHIPGRRPFGQNLVTVYIDGEQRMTSQLHFPSLSEVSESELKAFGFGLRGSNVFFCPSPA